MNTLTITLVSVLLTSFLGVIIGYARYVHNLKERVSVLESKIDDLKQELDSLKENIYKDISRMQDRLDSHSKKQDAILDRIGAMEKEVLKEMGAMGASISSLASDLKGLNKLISVSDYGIKINRN
jgi:uncharacterized membrane-anchored protein YhcB (DUF1043 family)